MNRLTRFSLRYPGRALAAAGLLLAAALPGLARLEMRTDGQALVPRHAPAVVHDREIRQRFGVRDPLVVVIRTGHPQGIFNPGTLRRVRDVTAALRQLEGLGPADVVSLATEPGLRFRPRSLQRSALIEPLPESAADLAALRGDLRRIGLYDGTLVSRDGRSAAVHVGVPPGADRRALYRAVLGIASRMPPPDRAHVLGAPVAETLLGGHILADLGVRPAWLGEVEEPGARRGTGLLPLAFAVMGLVFLIGFRRPAAALLPLVKVGCCLLVILGLMGWLDIPVYLPTAVLPIFLMVAGIADEAHLFRRYGEILRERRRGSSRDALAEMMEEMQGPVLRASVTTAVGFLSFGVSPLVPLQVFGVFAALGVLLCVLWSLTLTPALLALLPAGWIVPPAKASARTGAQLAALAGLTLRRRGLILAAALLATLAAVDGMRRVEVQDSWEDGFAPGSELAREMRRFDEQFRGSHLLLVSVEGEAARLAGEVAGGSLEDRSLALPRSVLPAGLDPARLAGSALRLERAPGAFGPREWFSWVERAEIEGGRLILGWPVYAGSPKFLFQPAPGERIGYEVRLEPLAVPATLQAIQGLERFLAERPRVGGTLGPAAFLETASFMTRPDQPGSRRLPERADDIRNLWENYGRMRGPEHLRRLVDPELSGALVTVFLKGSNFADTRRLMSDIRRYEAAHLSPAGLRLGFGGDVAVSQAMIEGVVTTQVRSLALSLLGIFALVALLERSWRAGLFCLIPPLFGVLLSFAAMGWLGIPLGIATSMFAGMALGMGVDYAIHLLARFRRLRAEASEEEALRGAILTAGPAILIDTASVALGISVLLLSDVPVNVRLGALLSLSLLASCAATLLLVPALIAWRSAPAASAFRDQQRPVDRPEIVVEG